MKLYKNIFFILMTIGLFGCKNETEKQIIGLWLIDEISFDNNDIKYTLLSNAIIFNENKSCDLPIVEISDRHSEKELGMWEVLNKNNKSLILIRTKNEMFSDTFLVEKFWKEKSIKESGYFFKAKLSSKKMKIIMTKG